MTQTVLALEDVNGWVDWWRYEVGMNVIPAISKEKKPIVEWKIYQTQPIPQNQHDEWKFNHKFDDGFAVILGKVWHNKSLRGYYLNMIDCDNAQAIQELFGIHDLNILGQRTIVEFHRDDLNRIHWYCYTIGETLREKSSDKGRLPIGAELDSIPAFEVKPSSKLLSFPCPNLHKNGSRYEIAGTNQIIILGNTELRDFQKRIDNILTKNDLLSNDHVKGEVPIEELFKPGCPILKGHNRHKGLLRMIDSLIANNRKNMSEEQVKLMARNFNTSEYLDPPLNDREFEETWQQSRVFISKNNNSSSNQVSAQNTKQKEKSDSKDKPVKKYQVYKYTKKDGLVEEIQLAGQNKFLQIREGQPIILNEIDLSEEKGMMLTPHNLLNTPIMPYVYDSIEDIQHFIELAKRMHIDDLYNLVKSIWNIAVHTKEKELISLLTIDTISSYFQEKFITTHYLLLSGPPGWGKGVILLTFKILGYRVVLAGDMSGANILDLLGPIEKCQISIAEDEFDNIHEDADKERIIKMGYEDIGLITRTVDPSSSDRTVRLYNPYCIKLFAGERAPDSKVLGGFNDRLFRAEVKKGRPKITMKEVKKQMEYPKDKQLPKYRKVIDRIQFLRKILPIYKLLHYDDVIDEVNSNITGRPLELTGQGLRLFHSDKLSNGMVFDEVRKALTHFLRKKGELDKKSIESVINDVLKGLFTQIDEGIIEKERKDEKQELNGNVVTLYKLTFDEICRNVMVAVDGNQVSARTFEAPEFPRVTHDSLIEICRRMFGGTDVRVRIPTDSYTKTKEVKALQFNKQLVDDAGKNFDTVTEIQVFETPDNGVFDEDPQISSMWDKAMLLSTNFENGPFSS